MMFPSSGETMPQWSKAAEQEMRQLGFKGIVGREHKVKVAEPSADDAFFIGKLGKAPIAQRFANTAVVDAAKGEVRIAKPQQIVVDHSASGSGFL